jgi:hypothetical protein
MNKETFDKIRVTLEEHIAACQFHLETIKTTDDLKRLTLENAQVLQRFCKTEETYMTKMAQCDLYHIIGMGNLTPPQMMKFTYLIRDYLKYRSTIKTLAANFDKISQLPGLPMSATYRTHGFDGLSLFSGVEFKTDVTSTVPYYISGNTIKVAKDKVTEFIDFWTKKNKVNFSENNFLNKAKAGLEYGGVKWTMDSEGDFVGVIVEANTKALFEGCYKAAQ